MNFFEHQARTQKRSYFIYILFIALVLVFCLTLSFSYSFLFQKYLCKGGNAGFSFYPSLNSCQNGLNIPAFFVVFSLNLLVVIIASSFKIFQMKKGGIAVVESFDGQVVHSLSKELHHKKLLNIVEEMAIASGCAVPMVYEIPSTSINAFVAGTKPSNTFLAMTSGAMQHLTRDELQAVVAHEFSHVFNRDMKINMDIIGVSYGLLFFYQVGSFILRGSSNKRRGKGSGGSIALLGLALMLLGGLGYFFSLFLKMALSRQREYLADASSSQYTRNPEALAKALKKIVLNGSHVKHSASSSTSHMFFANALKGFMRTHPPVESRIKRLGFDLGGLDIELLSSGSSLIGLATGMGKVAGESKSLVDSGAMSAVHDGLGSIPTPRLLGTPLKEAVHDAYSARAVILSLMISRSSKEDIEKKLQIIGAVLGEECQEICSYYIDNKIKIPKKESMDLIDMAIPSLRQLTRRQLRVFIKCVKDVIYVDKQIDHFEYMLYIILKNNLEDLLGSKKIRRSKKMLPYEVESILANALAFTCEAEPQITQKYHLALKELGVPLSYRRDLGQWDPLLYEYALNDLSKKTPLQQQKVVNSILSVIKEDGEIADRESEVLRSVCEKLSMPLLSIKSLEALA